MSEAADLSEESLLAEARAQANLSDFGDPRFREGLRVLLETYDGTANLSPAGRKRTRRRLVQLLATRLRVEDAWKRHPGVRSLAIQRPVYLTGLPRTGTSALFNLLACDRASRPLLLWEGIFPDPLPDLPPGAPDPRMEALRAHYARELAKNPGFEAIHEVRVDGPEECVLLLAHAFRDVQMGIEPLLEPYGAWFQTQDLRPAYRLYADLLRLLDRQRPGARWLLKSPAHLWALDVLLERFPDAGIVLTHRDPVTILGSYSSMMASLLRGKRDLEPATLGPVVLEYLARSLERGLAARDRSDPRRFLDVDYRAFVADPLAAAERIHAHFGLPLPGAAHDAMAAHVRASPQGRHGAHDYRLAEFGLRPEAVRERLAFYLERFDLRPGGAE